MSDDTPSPRTLQTRTAPNTPAYGTVSIGTPTYGAVTKSVLESLGEGADIPLQTRALAVAIPYVLNSFVDGDRTPVQSGTVVHMDGSDMHAVAAPDSARAAMVDYLADAIQPSGPDDVAKAQAEKVYEAAARWMAVTENRDAFIAAKESAAGAHR